jgi:glycosyltransferase involved in cell wall biosynthesis
MDIPYSISLSRFTRINHDQNKRQELGLSPSDLVVGSVGRLRREKGYTILLESASKVKKNISNVKFLIIGDGEQRNMLQQKSEQMGLGKTVIFAGALQDIESVYSVMDLFVLPSLWEGLPTVILESMACGVAVVATDIPGTQELVQADQTGWLAKAGDPDSLANCIVDALLDTAKKAEIAKKALQEVVPLFSMEYVASQYEDIYHKLVANTAGHTGA